MTRLDYLTLVASLPPMPAPGRARQLPISPQGLAQRLRTLGDDDAVLVESLRRGLGWSADRRDDLAGATALRGLFESPQLSADLRGVVDAQYRLRTLLAALRWRAGVGAGPELPMGMHPALRPRLRAHPTDAVFGLDDVLPWAAQVGALFEARDGAALERFLVRLQWGWYVEAGFGHEFDLEAVALYALRFDLLRHALVADGAEARRRFEAWVAEAVDAALPGSSRAVA